MGDETKTEDTSYEQEFEAALEGPAESPAKEEPPKTDPFDREAFAKEIREQVKKEYEPLIQSRINPLAEENRRLKAALDGVKTDVDGMKPVIDPLEAAFSGIDLEKLPEEQRAYFTDPHFVPAMKMLLGNVIRSYAPPKEEKPAAPAEMSPEERTQLETKAREHAVLVEQEVKKAHADCNEIYASPEFAEWYKGRGPRFVAWNGKLVPDITSPDPRHHIEVIGEYKLANKARLEAASDAQKKKEAEEALAGHGASKGGNPGSGSGAPTEDDILSMSPDDWKKYKSKAFR